MKGELRGEIQSMRCFNEKVDKMSQKLDMLMGLIIDRHKYQSIESLGVAD